MGESDDSPRRSPPFEGGDRGEAERGGRFRVETVHGEPYEVGGRRLIPVARLTSFGKARATIGTRQVSSWGGGFVQVTPLAVVEETPEGERRIAIADRTSRAMGGLVLGAAAIVLFFALIRWLARR
jgi:uncharacterized spore protein YtfJ